jgi:group I intron endonuclease
MARGIYKIINVVTNSFYIGSSVNLQKRKSRHFSTLRRGVHANRHLQAAWNKHGEAAFVFAIVEAHSEDVDLLEKENVWLREHVGKDYCYNMGTDATAPTLGWTGEKNPMWGRTFTHTKEAREAIRVASSGRIHTDNAKEKIAARLRGKPQPAKVRAKISVALSGEGNYWYGKKRPDHGAKVQKTIDATAPDGAPHRFKSIQALREQLDLKPSTVNNALKSGKPLARGPKRGWRFAYAVP